VTFTPHTSPPTGRWTTAELDAMPDDNRRRDLLDGALILHPSRPSPHRMIAARLMVALEQGCPDDYDVTQGMQIRLSATTAFVADGLVSRHHAAASNPTFYRPEDVLLVAEVVSRQSSALDRILKPSLYAKAGIPYITPPSSRHPLDVVVRWHAPPGAYHWYVVDVMGAP
jgi:Uma2 family endonuclease